MAEQVEYIKNFMLESMNCKTKAGSQTCEGKQKNPATLGIQKILPHTLCSTMYDMECSLVYAVENMLPYLGFQSSGMRRVTG